MTDEERLYCTVCGIEIPRVWAVLAPPFVYCGDGCQLEHEARTEYPPEEEDAEA